MTRAARRLVLIRTLVGRTTFLIREVRGDDYHDDGEPKLFNFFNIYSEARVRAAAESAGATRVSVELDEDFDGARINADVPAYGIETNLTRVVNGMQLRDYIVQPWSFVTIEKTER